ncbi:TonB-dependent siderophore receptor [Acinetobacter venetianus]|uniref:TonB-dependent siderophore receptor n=1 Tax=Acinetobacter venetianus TaxID=52133 RepID=UPI0010A5B182|nr:TonB-dependent siderophore receptor [Acinetobacter venetianus]MCR4529584.1 TonB-dependent siderophore receptor [Acinetobacter venetianus]MDA0695170.1 TonB-dependent siderophore receptor [Pseudomonadota bacterium]MDA1253128.1 TonB-dependent siderophore receptor [Pseudomonadota bacterium]
MLPPHRTLLATLVFGFMTTAYADDTTNTLPTISIQAEQDQTDTYVATQATSALKSDAPLFKTAQSFSVINQEQLEQKQAQTLAEAIDGVAGVVSGQLGRRGWDDFIIRGQNSSDQVFIDGLRQGQSTFVATELSGMDQVQVIKGPASVNFGLVQPGGMVNMVTKRPQADSFYRGSLTYGSNQLKQGTFDLNYSPNDSEKGAFRINGRVADQNDPTDFVYFKNYYISPSYNFDLGDDTDLSVIASYQHREYMRQQGLPILGTLLTNPNGALDSKLFISEPAHGGYNADVYRSGYNFAHTFENEWKFKQNFAVQKTDMVGPAVFAATGKNFWAKNTDGTIDYTTIQRQGRYQDVDNLSFSIDNQLQRRFNLANMSHELTIGIDAMQEKSDYINNRCTVGNLNLYHPQYNTKVSCPESPTNHDINRLRYTGLYLRDRIQLNDQWVLNLAGHHDWAETQNKNLVKNTESTQSDNAFTGNASLLYTINDIAAPYVSYATSFLPVSGTDANDNAFNPEKGKQVEVGLKLQSLDQRIQGSIAWFDLRRQNVSVSDPINSGFKVQRGEQMTRGIETEVTAHLFDQLKLTAAYTYTPDAKTTQDTTAENIGIRIDNIPKQSYSLSTRYRFEPNSNLGWYVGAGLRGETKKSIDGLAVDIPSYTVFDTEAGYDTEHWGAQFSIRNMFDKNYYAGALNENLITLGNPRQINFTVKFNY